MESNTGKPEIAYPTLPIGRPIGQSLDYVTTVPDLSHVSLVLLKYYFLFSIIC